MRQLAGESERRRCPRRDRAVTRFSRVCVLCTSKVLHRQCLWHLLLRRLVVHGVGVHVAIVGCRSATDCADRRVTDDAAAIRHTVHVATVRAQVHKGTLKSPVRGEGVLGMVGVTVPMRGVDRQQTGGAAVPSAAPEGASAAPHRHGTPQVVAKGVANSGCAGCQNGRQS